jgi:hypothetical protein
MNTAGDFIDEFVQDCDYASRDIITKVCKRAIRRMNNWHEDASIRGYKIKWEGKDGLLDGEFPLSFTFFDILSIQIQTYGYDEINPFLRDGIEDVLEYEFNKLPEPERIVVNYSEYPENYEIDNRRILDKIFDCFHVMLNDHWAGTEKIRRYEMNH